MMDSTSLRNLSGLATLLLLVSIIAAVGGIPAALLIAGTIDVWTAVAIYVVAAVLMTVASEALRRAVRNR